MSPAEVLDLARDGVWTMIIVSSPLMLVGLVVGLIIALFQALTQVQEITLVFVPKIVAIFLAFIVVLPFMSESLNTYMIRVASHISGG